MALIPETSLIENAHAIIHVIEQQWKTRHLVVVGDVMLDKYIHGDVQRISPEAPIAVVKVLQSSEQPGGAANVAMNAVALGAQVTLVGVVGDDGDGRCLEAKLDAAGVARALTVAPGRPTTAKTRVLGGRQQMLRLDVESSEPLAAQAQDEILSTMRNILERSAKGLSEPISAIVLSDYAKGVLTERSCRTILDWAEEFAIPAIVDPKGSDFSRYRGAAMICPNLAELVLAAGSVSTARVADIDPLLTAAEAMIAELGIGSLTVTQSERGMTYLDGTTRTHAPACARQVFDVSGAGDTVIAVLALCQAPGQALGEVGEINRLASIQLANLAAGIVVGKVGTAPVHAHELIAALAGQASESGGKILELDQMAQRAEAWRAAGERVVFTNGCFDLLHAGHITLLEAAKRQGGRLIVGLNSDASIRVLKGPSRPVTGQEHRARLLAALSAVDGVVIFSEPTPLETVLVLRPDVLVKGSDYAAEAVVGAAEVRSWGGELVLVPLIRDLSTTLSTTRILTRALAHSA